MTRSQTPVALARKCIYQSPWVNLWVDQVQFPNGSVIEQHHLLDFEHESVLILAQDPEARYLMVKVCRYPVQGSQWEFPAGRIEAGETVLQAAERELLEETGYQASHWETVYSYYPMNGIANQVFWIVRCQVGACVGLTDVNEIEDVRWSTKPELWRMIQDQELRDGYTLTAFLLDQTSSGG